MKKKITLPILLLISLLSFTSCSANDLVSYLPALIPIIITGVILAAIILLNGSVKELSDFEEEYFDACKAFGFKPYNVHTKIQIERKYKKLQNKRGEIPHDPGDNREEVLECAKEILLDYIKEIDKYLSANSEQEIKKRYEYFLQVNSKSKRRQDKQDGE